MNLTQDLAERFASITLGHLGREYPNKLDHVMSGWQDISAPAALHPIFHGSFDWHSCVHGWWQVMRLLRLFPDIAQAGDIRARADAMLTCENVAVERAYLARPGSSAFERPYGWAWLLALHGELARHDAAWAAALEPLARDFAARFPPYLAKLTYPIRTGTHGNSSFALILARDWATAHDLALIETADAAARRWFSGDRDCQAWEPGGDEFLSSALTEAMLMRRVLGADFENWWAAFLPRLSQDEPATLFTPATVSDRSDGKIAHLDGLNFSRAWCWRALGRADLAERHIAASLPHIAGEYAGEHWLATFALLALDVD